MKNELDLIIAKIEALARKFESQEERLKAIEQRLGLIKREEIPEPKPKVAPVEERRPVPEVPYKPIDWKNLEVKIGKYLMQIIGAAVFLLGMGFFLKYAIDQGWLSPAVRVGIGFATATAMVAVAAFLSQKFKNWAMGLLAGGIILYYFSHYAGFAFYHLFDQRVAFIGFVLIVIGTVIASIYYNAHLIGIMSLIGGFITPVLLYTGKPFFSFLIGYLLILSLGFVLLAYLKRWYSLIFLSFGSIVFYNMVALTNFFGGWPTGLTFNWYFVFFTGFTLIFAFLPFIYQVLVKEREGYVESVIVALTAAFGFFAMLEKIMTAIRLKPSVLEEAFWPLAKMFAGATFKSATITLSLSFGICYLALLIIQFLLKKQNRMVLGTLFTLVVSFFVIVLVMQFKEYQLTMAMQLYGLLLFGIGLIVQSIYVRVFAFLAWAYAFFNMIILYPWYGELEKLPSLLFNEINLATGILVVVFGGAAYLAYRYKELLSQEEKDIKLPVILEGGALATIFYWFHTPVIPIFFYYLIGLSLFSVVLVGVGIYFRRYLYIYSGFAVYLFTAVRFLFNEYFGSQATYYGYVLLRPFKLPFEQVTILFALFVGLAVLDVWLLQKFKDRFKEKDREVILPASKLVLVVLAWLWGDYTIRHYVTTYYEQLRAGLEVPERMHYMITARKMLNVWLSVYYGLYALIVILIGLFRKERVLRYFGLLLTVWVLIRLFSIIMALPGTVHRVIAFVAVGILFILVSFAYQWLAKKIEENGK